MAAVGYDTISHFLSMGLNHLSYCKTVEFMIGNLLRADLEELDLELASKESGWPAGAARA